LSRGDAASMSGTRTETSAQKAMNMGFASFIIYCNFIIKWWIISLFFGRIHV
jgi:hypothetical protein